MWIIWRERDRWRTLPLNWSWWGPLLLAAGALLQGLSVLGGGLFVGSVAFVISVCGVVMCYGGFPLIRAWAFPLLLMLFMLPKLAVVYNQFTLPLQLLASKMAAFMLTVTGFGVIREGNILDVGGHRIAVVEACNGVRYLLTLGFMAAVLAYLTSPHPWMRLALPLCALAVAILANALRVAASGAFPALAEGSLHMASGAVIFVLCLGTLLLLQRLLDGALNYA